MSGYPGGNKPADQCTYQEMVDRYWWEINRIHRLDWDLDLAETHRKNLMAFTHEYSEMVTGETVAEFKRRA